MTATPPGGFPAHQPYQPVPAPRTNGAAVASLICGILGCVPVITSLAAVILGVVGIKQSNKMQGSGKGLAIGGLILGIIGILGWISFGGISYYGYQYAKKVVLTPAQQTGAAFVSSLASGDIATAKTYTTDSFTDEQLSALSAKLRSAGAFKDFNLNKLDVQSTGGNSMRVTLGGTANFESGPRVFRAQLIGSTEGKFKIEEFDLD